MIFYNFARALRNSGKYAAADSALAQGLTINPASEPILMYSGRCRVADKDSVGAELYFEKLLKFNIKYFDAYIDLADIVKVKDVLKAREILRTCLRIDPRNVSAIKSLAGTYRKSNPEIAEKYDNLIKIINKPNN